MKGTGLIDDATALSLEAGWLREALMPVTSYGQRRFAAHEPFVPGQEALAQGHACGVMSVAEAMDDERIDAARDAARRAPDVSAALARASMGDELEDANFLELQRFFDVCTRLDALTHGIPVLPRIAGGAVRACARALERGRSGSFGFYLDDAFAPDLAAARSAFAAAQAEYDSVRGRAVAAISAQLGWEVAGNEFIVMRDDLPGALPPGVRVVREAPTYVLCEIDADEAVLSALARRDAAAERVAGAESLVRERLGSIVREHAAALDQATESFALVDCLLAIARFARTYSCSAPVLDARAAFALEGGCFVPLAERLEREGRSFTPIDLSLDGVAVLTGPNMGGKSVAMRTCGFVALCAAYGLPVPAGRARLPLFAQIAWLGVGSDESAGGLLSSFAREVVRLRDVLVCDARPRMLLLDEFARTTTPREGKALVVAVIERLQAERATALVATHVDGVAKAARVRHYAVRGLRGMPAAPSGDLHDALASLAASMDYTLEEVSGDRAYGADAIALAALLGIDWQLVDAAYAALEDA